MLRLNRAVATGLVALLSGCTTDVDDSLSPLRVDASYQLHFDGALVGHAFFTLRTDSDGNYRIEAFTVPAGQMQRAADHEVLEVSEGRIEARQVRPSYFEHSVLNSDDVGAVRMQFDWPGAQLQLSGRDTEKQITLLPNTQDRLSYLLVARQLALGAADTRDLPIATPQVTDENRLQRLGESEIELPGGRLAAIEIQRLTPAAEERRSLWFSESRCALPLRIEHQTEKHLVDMVLEHCNPVAEGG
ncbi:MAG: DUF3108 domain-containing protein [Gammaproteobacteria bacterium]|nr:DUF3108 domain-containing protein [Gammaproteobacteria bacterium]